MAKIGSRRRPSSTPGRASRVLLISVVGGLFLCWVLMGTFQAFNEIGLAQHHIPENKSALSSSRGNKTSTAATTDAHHQTSPQQHKQSPTTTSSSSTSKTTHSPMFKHTPPKTKTTTTSSSSSSGVKSPPSKKSPPKGKSPPKHPDHSHLFPSSGDTIHVLMTSGGGAYQNFQSRVMYGTYKMVQKEPGGEKLVGFTRILHRVLPDALIHEMPTFHAKPLQPLCDEWCDFPPASRPNAVKQFIEAAKKEPAMIKAPWLFMTEPDYVWMKPLQAPPAEDSSAPSLVFRFGYIEPTAPELFDIMSSLYPGDLKEIPETGPAPALLRVREWLGVIPYWERLTAEIEADTEAKEKLGWVREMYAFAVGCALRRLKLDLRREPENLLMMQPPQDEVLGAAAMMHYTWATVIVDEQGAEIWKFEKREYTEEMWEKAPEQLPEVPEFDAHGGWRLKDGKLVTRELRDTLNMMIQTMNRAIEKLKPL